VSWDGATALSDVITAVAAKITGMNVGKVYGYIPLLVTQSAFEAAFKDDANNRILGWAVTRENTASEDKKIQANADEHLVIVRGYMGIGDQGATETTFQGLIEAMRNAFKQDRKLGGKAFYCRPMGARLVTSGVLGNVLCHYCELTLPVQIYPLIN
jgi:hypothetical protein